MKLLVSRRQHLRGLLLILAIGMALCVWQLGATGLVDETPPLFAAAGRAMAVTGDWITPRVNGLPRFDKPPLIYWLMGLGYSLPGQEVWDPLGTWSARLPSSLASVWMMILLGDTVMRWPQKEDVFPRRTAVVTALAFALSPLVMIWSRTAVSDSLLCSTLGVSLLLQWRCYANPAKQSWWSAWAVLGLAVLTKGPVAVVLMGMILVLFGWQQVDFASLFRRLRPIAGIGITALISLPWYLIELVVEGKPFWNSFFGYHNFQRFTSVVNSHQEPWWFFCLVLVIASLPFTPLLILGLLRAFPTWWRDGSEKKLPEESLTVFAACWLISVFVLFTCSATKLPSYWLPATPAAAILIAFAVNRSRVSDRDLGLLIGWGGSAFLALVLSLVLWFSPFWLLSIKDPEIPNFGAELLQSRLLLIGAFCLSASAFSGLLYASTKWPGRLLVMQGPVVFFQLLVLVPMFGLADKLRQLPLRQAAQLLVESQKPLEPLVMVGAMKPSMHFYTKQVVVYEGRSSGALVNLVDRLRAEKRQGWIGRPIDSPKGISTALVVIDQKTAKRSYWLGLQPEILGQFGIYKVWRLNRYLLEERANQIVESGGIRPNWRDPRPERF